MNGILLRNCSVNIAQNQTKINTGKHAKSLGTLVCVNLSLTIKWQS